jgi:hypothetical protein
LPDEYKALTVINLPFKGRAYQPGEMIPRSDFEDNAGGEGAPEADDEIAGLIAAGALSEDPNAPLVNPPLDLETINLNSVVQEARTLVAQMEEEGKEIPPELTSFAQLDVQAISANDVVTSDEKGA